MTAALAALLLAAAPARPVLTWGADSQGGAPYVFQDPMDPTRLVGFEVELAGLLAERLGAQPVPVHGPWASLLELLARGDFDLALNGLEVAEEKRRVVALSRPYYAAPLVLTVRRGGPPAPRTRSGLAGLTIGTLPGSLAERIAVAAGARVRTYDGGQNDLYDDLKLGRVDGVLLDEPAAHYYGDLEDSLVTVKGDFGVVTYAVALRLDDAGRLAAVDAALDALNTEGALRRLYQRWGLWNAETAALLHDQPGEGEPAVEYERWRAAVGTLPSLGERLRTRYPALLPLFARGAAMTLGLSLAAMALAVLLGVALALGRRARVAPVRWAAAAYIEFFRGTPLLIQLTMVYFGLPELGLKLDPFLAGVVALGLNYAAAEAENYRAGLESVPDGQLEAAAVLGLSGWQTLRLVVAPQAVRVSLPPMTNDFIALLKDSSLVSVVTLTELTKTYTSLASSTRDHLGLGVVVALWYLAVGLPFAWLARRAERHFGRHLGRDQPVTLEVRELVRRHPGAAEPTLRGLSFALQAGTLTALLGRSGAGKSTLLRCVMGLEDFEAGSIAVDGVTVLGTSQVSPAVRRRSLAAARTRLGLVFQAYELFPHLTVLDNCALAPVQVKGLSRARAVEHARGLLVQLGLEDHLGAWPAQLSGGQRQRVAIARALAMEPRVLLYDEPTSALDPSMKHEVLQTLKRVDATGVTQLVVTHDLQLARGVEHVCVLDGGRVVEEGPPEQVLRQPTHEATRALLRASL